MQASMGIELEPDFVVSMTVVLIVDLIVVNVDVCAVAVVNVNYDLHHVKKPLSYAYKWTKTLPRALHQQCKPSSA